MISTTLIGFIALAPILAFTALAVLSAFHYGQRPLLLNRLALVAGVFAVLVSAFLASQVALNGVYTIGFLQLTPIHWFIRLDELSVIMLSMVSVIGFFVLKYSHKYLDGDEKQGAFTGRLVATIASVQVVIMAGSLSLLLLGWFLTSSALNRLLLFYPNRSGAIIAARKKYIMARLSELFFQRFEARQSPVTFGLQLLNLLA